MLNGYDIDRALDAVRRSIVNAFIEGDLTGLGLDGAMLALTATRTHLLGRLREKIDGDLGGAPEEPIIRG